eukprot:3416800-Prymnesium_polylepis.1
MLSITAVGWRHAVLKQPRHRCRDAMTRLRDGKYVTRSAPGLGLVSGGFTVYTCVHDSFDRMLSITAVGWRHT